MRTAPAPIRRVAATVVCGLLLSMVGPVRGEAARAPQDVEYGYPEQSIFLASKDAQGRVDSPMLHLATALLERAGVRWRAAPYPAARLFRNLQDGTTNFSILVRSPAVESCCVVSKAPVFRTVLGIFYLGEHPPVKRKEDLAGRSVITVAGYSYAGLLAYLNDPANRIRNEAAPSHKAAFEMLAARRADYLIDYASAAGDLLASFPIDGLRMDPLDRVEIFLVLSRAYPDAEAFLGRLESIAATLKMDEVLKGRDRR